MAEPPRSPVCWSLSKVKVWVAPRGPAEEGGDFCQEIAPFLDRTPEGSPQKEGHLQGFLRVSEGTRTPDRLDHNQELDQLSYAHRGQVNLPAPGPCRAQRRSVPRGTLFTPAPSGL